MRVPKGLTLLEVLLAVVLLAVVYLALGALQTTGLRTVESGRRTQEAASLAESFLEDLRKDPSRLPQTCSGNLTFGGGYRGSCTYTPCSLEGEALACQEGIPSPGAYRVRVTVSRGGKELVSLEGVVGR